MLDSRRRPERDQELLAGMTEFLDRNAERGWKNLSDFRGLRRDRVVTHSQIKRPDTADYHGGYADEARGIREADRGVSKGVPAVHAPQST